MTTACPWKGTASYYNINVNGKLSVGDSDKSPLSDIKGQEATNAAWYYPHPKTERANGLKDHVAFCECMSWVPERARVC